jgi:hypothetical protein
VRPVLQTRFGRPLGNCWAASIASILELPLEDVDWSADMTADEIEPPGADDCSEEWKARLEAKLVRLGYWMARQAYHEDQVMPKGVHYLALGILPNGIGHVCVYREGLLVHDPHPGLDPLKTIEEIAFLVRR